jgi:metal-responsive CopG/Arc/MetJ family transcriptional regulator
MAEKIKRGPKPTGKGEQVVVRIQPDLLAAVDKYQKVTGEESRPAAIRQVLTDFFKQKAWL